MLAERSIKCTEADCSQSFTKHHQLRAHISTFHSPVGTKPYRCEHPDCPKSFATNQKLRAHQKTHDEKRYTCSHPSCLSLPSLPFFSNWTKLQAHMRATHPPTCPYTECQGKSFGHQKGLKAHLKVHEGRDVDRRLDGEGGATDYDEPVTKRRKGGDRGRDWVCDFGGCMKDFKSVFSLPPTLFLLPHILDLNRKKLLQRITTSRTSTSAILHVLMKIAASPTVTNTFSSDMSRTRTDQ